MIAEKIKRLPPELLRLIRLAQETADGMRCQAYLVGGFVRDLLLGRDNLDLDIVVEADGIDFARRLADLTGAGLVRHRQFGTATLALENKTKIDVATARKESYRAPAALPDVESG